MSGRIKISTGRPAAAFRFPLFSILINSRTRRVHQVMMTPNACVLGSTGGPAYGLKLYGGDGTVIVFPQEIVEDQFEPRDGEPLG